MPYTLGTNYGVIESEIYLRIDREFIPLKEYINKRSQYNAHKKHHKIDIYTLDGALSIVYSGNELLGERYWDEINGVLDSIISQIPSFLDDKPIVEYMPIQSIWINIKPAGEYAVWRLTPAKKDGASIVSQVIPSCLLFQAIALSYIRMAKILAFFGNQSYSETVSSWSRELPAGIQKAVLAPEELLRVAQTDLHDPELYL